MENKPEKSDKLAKSERSEKRVARRRQPGKKASPVLRGLSIPIATVAGILLLGLVVIPAALKLTAPKLITEVTVPVEQEQPELFDLPVEPTTSDIPLSAAGTPPPEAPEASVAYRFGDEADIIATIQERLMALCYMDSDEPTSYFGPATEAALKRFQRVHYMAESGVADEQTTSVLFSDNAMIYTIEQGDSGEDVDTMQERLNELGYYEGKINGFFGTATKRALEAFQTKNKMEINGIADQDTRDFLYSSRAKPKIDPTPTPKPTPTPTKKPKSTPKQDGGGGGGGGSVAVVASKDAEGLISVAKAQLNKPYVWGDEGPNSFDCSGLVCFSLRSIGASAGRLNAAGFSEVVSWTTINGTGNLQPGDLIFFKSDSSSRISHTGIWLGGNKYIHASSSAGKVVISSWSNWAERNFTHGKRVF